MISTMGRFDIQLVQATILNALGWARIGITAPNERTREAAASELAAVIVSAISGSQESKDTRQMALPL